MIKSLVFTILLLTQATFAQVVLKQVTVGTPTQTLLWDYPSADLPLIDDFELEIASLEAGPWTRQAIIVKTSQTYVYNTSALAVGDKKYFRVYARKGQPSPIPDDRYGPSNLTGLQIIAASAGPGIPSALRFALFLKHKLFYDHDNL